MDSPYTDDLFSSEGGSLTRFGKAEFSPAPGPESAGAGTSSTTVIGPGARFVGELFGEEDVVVHGRLEGKIRVGGEVEIGPAGEIVGDVEARSVRIAGRVRGEVRASERAELYVSAIVHGILQAPKLIIAEGAQLDGNVAMKTEEG